MVRASKTALLFGIAALAALASGPNPSALPPPIERCQTLLQGSGGADCSLYNNLVVELESGLRRQGVHKEPVRPVKVGMGAPLPERLKQTLLREEKETLVTQRPLGRAPGR